MGMIWGLYGDYRGIVQGLHRDHIGIVFLFPYAERVRNLSKHLSLDIQILNHEYPNHGFIG